MASIERSKFSAFLLAFLMATISMSATMQSWEFSTLKQESTVQNVPSNSTVNVIAGFGTLIETGLTGNSQSGTYEASSEVDGMYFNIDGENSVENKMALGAETTCFIAKNGDLYCVGSNYYGALGIGGDTSSTSIKSTFQKVDLGIGRIATSIVSSSYSVSSRTCAILDNGDLKCWGGYSASLPQEVDLGVGVKAVSVGVSYSHTCAILDDGTLKCWGYNSYGQLGIGSTTASTSPQQVNLGTGRTAVSVAVSGSSNSHTCAILDDGSLKCWGYNLNGQLGIGSTTASSIPQQVNLGTGRTAISVSAGATHTCAVLDDGSLKCWGKNDYSGLLGIGSTLSQNYLTPQFIGGGYTSVSASQSHSCAVLNDGSAWCWGINSYGRLGTLSPAYSTSPTQVQLTESVSSIYTGLTHTCAILFDDTIKCWGRNNKAQLGLDESTTQYNTPIEFGYKFQSTFSEVATAWYHTCAITSMGNLNCWGAGMWGYLGFGTTESHYSPRKLNLGENRTAISVSTRTRHTCAILDDGTLKCWGVNNYGQLGIGSTVQKDTPQLVDIGIGRTAVSVSAGDQHTCAILDDGSLKCWGSNSHGQIGVDSTNWNFAYSTPELVDLGVGRTALSVSTGGYHTCAVLDDYSLKCWGKNDYGQTAGSGTQTEREESPIVVNLGTGRTALSVSTGLHHTCVVLDDNSLKCWGDNVYGQLGVGDFTDRYVPTLVDLGTGRGAVSVSTGDGHTCAILDNSSLKCWGRNNDAQLGIGSLGTNQNSPQLVATGSGFFNISMSQGHSCAILDNGSLNCWGESEYGKLGIGSSIVVSYPTPQYVNSFDTIAIKVSNLTNSNSWYGTPLDTGVFNLDVWYNTTNSNTFHRVIINSLEAIEYPNISHQYTVNQNLAINPINIICSSCFRTISSILPTGLVFNPNNAVISGDSTEISPDRPYSIISYTPDGSSITNINLEIVDNIPNISTTSNSINYLKGFKHEPNNMINSGGILTSSILHPEINGLSSFNTNHENLILNSAHSCGIISTGVNCWGIGDLVSNLPGESYFNYDATNINDISESSTNICIVKFQTIVECIGQNNNGQINGSAHPNSIYSQFTPLIHSSAYSINQIAVTGNEVCILNEIKQISCQGSSNYLIDLGSYGEINNLDSGESHYCISSSLLYCWGNNQYSAIGTTQTASSYSHYDSTSPQKIDIGTGFTVLHYDAGQKHTCVVRNDGSIMCWGTGTNGQLGNGYVSTQSLPQNIDSPLWATYTKVSAGNSHTCAMLDDNGVMCWGNNSHGQLGDGTITDQLTPVNVSIIPSWMNVVDVVAGDGGTCVIDDLAAVWCWGDNSNQKLGLNSSISVATIPQPIRFSDSASLIGVLPMGVLSGAPLVAQSTTVHRLYGNNSGGYDDVNITITVGIAADYPITHLNLT